MALTRKQQPVFASGIIIIVVGVIMGYNFFSRPRFVTPPQLATPAKTHSTDACDLLTAADASTVLKSSAHQVFHSSNKDKPGVIIPATTCGYHTEASGGRREALLTVVVNFADDVTKKAQNKGNFDASRPNTAIEIPHLGDSAYFDPSVGINKLHVLSGSFHIVVDAGDDSQAFPDQATDAAAATLIISKLPV